MRKNTTPVRHFELRMKCCHFSWLFQYVRCKSLYAVNRDTVYLSVSQPDLSLCSLKCDLHCISETLKINNCINKYGTCRSIVSICRIPINEPNRYSIHLKSHGGWDTLNPVQLLRLQKWVAVWPRMTLNMKARWRPHSTDLQQCEEECRLTTALVSLREVSEVRIVYCWCRLSNSIAQRLLSVWAVRDKVWTRLYLSSPLPRWLLQLDWWMCWLQADSI